ncbi:hypothetical protein KKF34_19055 [Myxococcota bacterium]|nr:hypothetical protein [Myxococcota bacterium]MBU1382838.1 hypothetical protein [Myxococcota bacterium]MBU1498987.1 hypothetical protein [Myxococcota bacterium]
MKKLFLTFAIFTIIFAGCDDSEQENNNVDPCSVLDCTENAYCDDSSLPAQCRCNDGYTIENAQCINSKTVACLDVAPENATSTITDVEITWDPENLWSQATPCSWDCDEGYVQEGEICVSEQTEVPLDGFGAISGECGVVTPENLQSADPEFFVNTLNFADDPYNESDYDLLTAGGQYIADTENAGGSSIWSEVFAFEVLARCELAGFLKAETEIVYDVEGKITDILVFIDGYKVGVSVTRVMSFPRDQPVDPVAIEDLLVKKLEGIIESSENVSDEDAWIKQVLSIMVDRTEHVTVVETVWESIEESIRSNTILYLTVTEGSDDFIYTNEL